MTLQYTLVHFEEQFCMAADNGEFYREHFAEGLMIFPAGVLTKDEIIPAVNASAPWASFRIDNPRVIHLSDESACLTCRATARRAGQANYDALIPSVYVKRDGAWRMAPHQQTPADAAQ